MEVKKIIYVPDTSLLVHDPRSLRSFEEHDVTILNTVLEELDDLKKGNDEKAFVARDLHRTFDQLSEILIPEPPKKGSKSNKKVNPPNVIPEKVSALFNGGVSLGEGLGKIEIKTIDLTLHPRLKKSYSATIADHRILSGVLTLMDEYKGVARVVLVSKDINMRLKAKSLGIKVENYRNDQVPNVDTLHKGRGEIIGVELEDVIAELHTRGRAKIPYPDENSKEFLKTKFQSNMYFILKTKSSDDETYARLDPDMKYFIKLERKPVFRILPRNAEQVFAVDAMLDPNIKLVILDGKAGTGKTLLAIASALYMLESHEFETILLSASMVTLGDRDMGALPGDAKEKVLPFMQGLYDNLAFVKSQFNKSKSHTKELPAANSKKTNAKKTLPAKSKDHDTDFISISMKDEKILVQPLGYIRGRTLNNTCFIVDEGQNLTPHEVKTIITRAGENTKIAFLGDIHQIDGRYLDIYSNGLSHAIHKLSGKPIVAHVTLEKGERSALAELAADLL